MTLRRVLAGRRVAPNLPHPCPKGVEKNNSSMDNIETTDIQKSFRAVPIGGIFTTSYSSSIWVKDSPATAHNGYVGRTFEQSQAVWHRELIDRRPLGE